MMQPQADDGSSADGRLGVETLVRFCPATASDPNAASVQARWLVESYPYNPDSLSLCNVLGAHPSFAHAMSFLRAVSMMQPPVSGHVLNRGLF